MGRIIVVGDRHQSIYGFRGADITAIPSLVEMMQGRPNGCREFPLSVCRRSPRSHIRLAQAIVPDIQWMTVANSGIEAPEGEIYQVSMNIALDMMKEGDMGIGRTNKVLIPPAYQLIRMRKKVVIRGRDIGTGLISLIKKMKATSIENLLYKMGKWFEKEVRKLCAKEGVDDPSLLQKGATKYQSLEDKVSCIEALCDGIDTLDELIVTIEKLFADFDDSGKPKQAIVLGTVHRTKGLESHNVTVIDPENFPHSLARKSWEKVQERNLAYVAATRAKFSLGKDGSVIEPGRLIFIGACPSIYKAQWLMGLNKYPNDGKPFPVSQPTPPPAQVEKPAVDEDRVALEKKLVDFYKRYGVEKKVALQAAGGLSKDQLTQCVTQFETAIANQPKLTAEQEKILEEEKRHEAMMRAIEEANV